MKKKAIIVSSILLLPSLIYLFSYYAVLDVNLKRLPFYGSHTINAEGDSIYYQANGFSLLSETGAIFNEKHFEGRAFIVSFIDTALKEEGFHLGGLGDYFHYKPKDLDNIPILFHLDSTSNKQMDFTTIVKFPKSNKIYNLYTSASVLEALKNENYFRGISAEKNLVLLDSKRRIRGYYDGRYNAEIKKMIEDYNFLLRHDITREMANNKIEKRSE